MLRTYGRRLRRRRTVQSQPKDEVDPPVPGPSFESPPRKRHKVFVEIVSPKRKEPKPIASPRNTYGSPETPERARKSVTPFSTTPSRPDSPVKRESVVKRMLGRSKTEQILSATPVGETTSVSAAMVRQASSQSLPTTFPETETPETSAQSSPKPLLARNIRTYAGSSRSFLVALPMTGATDPSNTVDDDTEPHESYADLRTRWGIDVSEDDPQPSQDETPLRRTASELSQPSHATNMMNDLKSITELRSKGESRRFLDEVGYLFEGLDSSSAIGLRRASAFEIVNKLCDVDFNRRAKTSDFYTRTWNKFWTARAGTCDKIFDATIAFFTVLAARDPCTLLELAQHDEFIPTLVEILSSLDHTKDILALVLITGLDNDLKSHGILRTEITALKSLAGLVSAESRTSSFHQPSARFFVSHSLATLPPALLVGRYLPTLLINLRAELALLEPRITAYESGLSLLPPNGINRLDIPSFYHIEACLRLLDSYLLGHWSPASSNTASGLSHVTGFTSELVSLCVASSSVLEDSQEEMVIARRCLCGALRVLTLLSHDDPWWCTAASEVPYALQFAALTAMRSQAKWFESRTMESANSPVEAFDLLCLALGLIMNWATLSPNVTVLSRVKLINPTCPGSRLCVRACRCENQKPVLECLVALHVQYPDYDKDDSPECAFLRGYTAILLGLLMKDDPTNQTIVKSILPGTSPCDRIKSLISHCRSFLDLYTSGDTVSLSSPDSPRVTPEETSQMTSGHHRATWDKSGEQIARSVIASLEILCDT